MKIKKILAQWATQGIELSFGKMHSISQTQENQKNKTEEKR